jgi:hypothetical protein
MGCAVCPHDPEALAAALKVALRHAGPTTGRSDINHLERSVVARRVIAVYEKVTRYAAPETAMSQPEKGSHHVEIA